MVLHKLSVLTKNGVRGIVCLEGSEKLELFNFCKSFIVIGVIWVVCTIVLLERLTYPTNFKIVLY